MGLKWTLYGALLCWPLKVSDMLISWCFKLSPNQSVQSVNVRFHRAKAIAKVTALRNGFCTHFSDVAFETIFVYCCQCSRYYCSFMYCRINKLKKWLFYIYLLTTITKALYQPSEKGMSLLFTCPQLTKESSLAAAARTRLHTACIM